jgi:hypothetical protein
MRSTDKLMRWEVTTAAGVAESAWAPATPEECAALHDVLTDWPLTSLRLEHPDGTEEFFNPQHVVSVRVVTKDASP